MRAIFFTGAALLTLAICPGCAGRAVTYTHYPNVSHTSEFYRQAKKECAKYGLEPLFSDQSSAWWRGEPERESITYYCR